MANSAVQCYKLRSKELHHFLVSFVYLGYRDVCICRYICISGESVEIGGRFINVEAGKCRISGLSVGSCCGPFSYSGKCKYP